MKSKEFSILIRRKTMRLDKFLQVSRIIKRRTIASKICNGGNVKVNEQVGKPSKTLKVGDILEINFGSRGTLVCEVLDVPERGIRKDQAESLYKVISETRPAGEEEY